MKWWQWLLKIFGAILAYRAGKKAQATTDQQVTNDAIDRENNAAAPSTDDDTIDHANQGTF